MSRILSNAEVIPQIISEIVKLEPELVAIACIMVLKDGNIKTKNAFTEGNKLPLVAGVALHQQDFCRAISADTPINLTMQK